jgi:hypothetical protein
MGMAKKQADDDRDIFDKALDAAPAVGLIGGAIVGRSVLKRLYRKAAKTPQSQWKKLGLTEDDIVGFRNRRGITIGTLIPAAGGGAAGYAVDIAVELGRRKSRRRK